MQGNLKCGFCNDDYNSSINIPKTLPCGHIKCSVCINAEFRKSQQYICTQCKGVFKDQPQNLPENGEIVNRIKLQEAKKQSIGIEKLKEEKEKIQFTIKNITEQQSFICKKIIDQLDTILFSRSNQITFQFSQYISILNKKIKQFEQDSSLEDEEDGNQNENNNVEIIDLQKIEILQQQGQQEIQKLYEIQKQLFKQSEILFEDVFRGELLNTPRVQRNIPVNNERQENRRSLVRESFIHTYRQRQHLIHVFEDCSQNLHIFDAEQNKQDKISLTISIPQ